jgi:hypothetical protein
MHAGQASISGRILNVYSSPYPAKVWVFQILIHDGFATMLPSCVTDTDLEGKFECSKLPDGKFIVEVLPSRRSKSQKQKAPDSEGEAIPASIFYPGVTDIEDAMPIFLHANEAGWDDIRVAYAPTVEVTGELTDHVPPASFKLEALSEDGLVLDTGIQPTYDRRTGRFSISNVPAGHYQLTANWLTSRDIGHATLPFAVGVNPVDRLLLSSMLDVEITGRLSALPAGVTVSQVTLASTDGSIRDLSAPVKDGTFNFRSVPVGTYTLSFPSSQQVYVDAISVGGNSFSGSRFTVSPGQRTLNLELVVKGPSIPLQGSVKKWDGEDKSAEVIAQSEESGQIYKVTTDGQRRFSFPGVKPGTYRMFAWPGVDAIEYRNPVALRKYKDDSAEVSVEQDGLISTIELTPIEIK